VDGLGPLLVAQATGNRHAGSARHPPLLARVTGTRRSPGGSVAAPFRAGALRARRLPQDRRPAPAAAGAPPSAGGHACKSGPAVPLAPGILSPSKDHRQGARLRRGAARWRKRHPWSSDLPRRTSAPIEGRQGVEAVLSLTVKCSASVPESVCKRV
jgi:hypothetical protein